MGLSIIPVGGYGEVGRNCTAVVVDDEVFLLDIGLHVDNYVRVSQDEDVNTRLSKKVLIREQAVPDISVLDPVKKQVKALLISHAHLDHVGAVPYLANTFGCPIHATPFTIEVLRRLLVDKRTELRNELVSHPFGEVFPLSDKVSAELVEVTHSTPHSAAIVLHTPYGVVLYLNDFKLDETPPLGGVTNLARLSALRPRVVILDSLYADVDAHTPSEAVAHTLLEDALLTRDLSGRNVLITTFSSHIARLHAIARSARKMGRKVMFVGRSMAKYLEAAREAGLSRLIDEHEVVRYGSKVRKALRSVAVHHEYVFVVTGGMAEPKAVLSRIIDEELVPLRRGDVIIFSNKVIPTPTIIAAREHLEHRLISMGFEVLRDLHVSGHGAARDHRVILEKLSPQFVLPVHGDDDQRRALQSLAVALGFSPDHVPLLRNGEVFSVLS